MRIFNVVVHGVPAGTSGSKWTEENAMAATFAVNSNLPAGRLLMLTQLNYLDSPITGITDSQGGEWVRVVSETSENGPQPSRFERWVCLLAVPYLSTDTITVDGPATTFGRNVLHCSVLGATGQELTSERLLIQPGIELAKNLSGLTLPDEWDATVFVENWAYKRTGLDMPDYNSGSATYDAPPGSWSTLNREWLIKFLSDVSTSVATFETVYKDHPAGYAAPPGEYDYEGDFPDFKFWVLAMPLPAVLGQTAPEQERGTPAHVVISPAGEVAFPLVEGFIGLERANGGQVAMTGRISEEFVRRYPKVFEQGSDWLVAMKETGGVLAFGELKRPPHNGGVADLAASGASRFAEREVRSLFYADYGFDSYVTQDTEPHYRGRSPGHGPALEIDGDGNVPPGAHKYKVAFISIEGTTKAGPRTRVFVPWFHSPAWDDATAYVNGDRVTHNEKGWKAVGGGSTNEEPTGAAPHWDELTVNELGDWDIGHAYVLDDAVTHSGSTWRATGSSTGQEPTGAAPDWEKVSATIQLTDISRGPDWVTARAVYRTPADEDTYQLLEVIGNNSATTYTDSTNDSGLLDAEPQDSWSAAEIDVSVEHGAIVFKVTRGATVFDQQRTRIIRALSGEETFSRVELDGLTKNRDTGTYTLLIEVADDEDGEFSTVESVAMGEDGPASVEVKIPGGNSVVAYSLQRNGDAVNAKPFKLRIPSARLFGRAPDDTFTASDIVRDTCRVAGVSDRYVIESATPALPAEFAATPLSEVNDLMAVYTNRVWLYWREGLDEVCYFGPTGRRRWVLADPWSLRDLVPQLPYSRVVLTYKWDDGVATGWVEAVADPNPLGRIVTAPPLALEAPGSRDLAQVVCQHLADFYVQDRSSGTLTFKRLQDESGLWWDGQHCMAGDEIYVPQDRVWVFVDQIEHRDEYVIAKVGDVPVKILQRYNAKVARRRAARGL